MNTPNGYCGTKMAILSTRAFTGQIQPMHWILRILKSWLGLRNWHKRSSAGGITIWNSIFYMLARQWVNIIRICRAKLPIGRHCRSYGTPRQTPTSWHAMLPSFHRWDYATEWESVRMWAHFGLIEPWPSGWIIQMITLHRTRSGPACIAYGWNPW